MIHGQSPPVAWRSSIVSWFNLQVIITILHERYSKLPVSDRPRSWEHTLDVAPENEGFTRCGTFLNIDFDLLAC
jgi:hypothetical protein